MDSKLSIAKYILAVATNTVTDSIRESYIQSVDADKAIGCEKILNTLLTTVQKSMDIDKYDVDTAKTIVETEFTKLNLANVLGEYTAYSAFVDLLVDTHSKQYMYSELMGLYKHWVEVADTLQDNLKTYIYHGVLNSLVKRNLVTEDLDFSEKVTAFVDGTDISEEERHLYNIVVTTLGNA